MVDAYDNKILRFCGFGSITNYHSMPKTLKCTDLYGQTSADCSTLANTVCTYWTDRDNNICTNDYGGPLYRYSYVDKTITQYVVALASYSPNLSSASCTGRQKIVHTQVAFYAEWIGAQISKT